MMRMLHFWHTLMHDICPLCWSPWPWMTAPIASETCFAVIWSKWLLGFSLLSPSGSIVVVVQSESWALMWHSRRCGLHWRVFLLLISDSLQLLKRLIMASLLLLYTTVSEHTTPASFYVSAQLWFAPTSSRTFRWISYNSFFLWLTRLSLQLLILLLIDLGQILHLILEKSDVLL